MSGVYKKIRIAGAEMLGVAKTGPRYDDEISDEYLAFQREAIRKALPEVETLKWKSEFAW